MVHFNNKLYRVLLGYPLKGASEKLLDIKTARFYGKVFLGHESVRFMPKKLLNDKIFIFWR